MVKNYIKMALRSLAKNKLVSFINIFGLSVAVAVSIVVFVLIKFDMDMDRHHANRDSIYLIMNSVERDGSEQTWGDSPEPIGAMLTADYPQIAAVARIANKSVIFKYGDQVFNEYTRFVDPDFMNMFSYEIKYGDKNALEDKTRIIISNKIAEKYFGDTNPVGEQVVLNYGTDKVGTYIIGAVVEKLPETSSFSFAVLSNWQNKIDLYRDDDPNDWTTFITATFIQLRNQEDLAVIEAGMSKYVDLQNRVDKDWPAKSYPIAPFNTLSANAYKYNGIMVNGDEPTGKIVLTTIAIFLLALASFNYMNISIVSATKRLKEIGLRKTLGGSKTQLIRQFLLENILLTLFALILGTILAKFLFVPWFDDLFSIGLEFSLLQSLDIWFFFLGMLILLGLFSGAYPAFYISSFKPVDIFRGSVGPSGKNRFTKVFLTFQFILSLLAIICGIIFIQNVDYQKNQDWGYTQDQIYALRVPDGDSYRMIKNEVSQNPNVLSVTGSVNHIGSSFRLGVIDKDDKKYEIMRLNVGANYIDAMGIRLIEGRDFNAELKTDEQAVIVNETFVANIGWDNIIDNTFIFDSAEYTIIGIAEDYHYASFWNKIESAMLIMEPDDNFRFLQAKISGGNAVETTAYFEETWKELMPDHPFTGFFQDTVFDNYFTQITSHSKLMGFTASLAIILSCLGLFGLVSLSVAAKKKDYSIRKVLGAGSLEMAKNVNQQYIWILLVATIIGAPLSYYIMIFFMDTVYDYHIPIYFSSIVSGVVGIFAIAFLTVSVLVVKVIRDNPVDALRNE